MKDIDSYLLEEAYENIFFNQALLQEKTIPIKRIDDKTIEVDEQQMDITDFLFQITDGGRQKLTVQTIRRRDKKVGGRIIARAGDTLIMNGKLGACRRDVSGAGGPMGGPIRKYKTYDLIAMCANRGSGKHVTRNLATDAIFKVNTSGNTYEFV